jgi:ribosomal protein S12 methylthiotransferase accessory factor
VALVTTYLNERIELVDAVYSERRRAELEALLRPYNRLLGPVTSVSVYRPGILDLSMYAGMARHSRLRSLVQDVAVKPRRGDDGAVPGGGKGSTMQRAFLGALGEITERLLTVLHLEAIVDELVFASYDDLVGEGRRALGPDALPLFAPEQYSRPGFGYARFATDTPLSWIEGSSLLSGESVLVPAQLVLFHYQRRVGEARIGYATTGGLGFHSDRRRAILHGLYEYIERDAINVRWYSRLPPLRIDVDLTDVLSRECDAPRARISTPYIEGVDVYLNTLDVPIPVLTAAARDHSRQERAFVSGGGAWSRRERALMQALYELGQSRNFFKLYNPLTMKDVRADTDVAEMTDFFHAAVYYGYVENLPRIAWYMGGLDTTPWHAVPSLDVGDDADEYEAMLERLRAVAIDPIVLNFGGAGWPGVAVVKVFVPQLTQASVPSHPYLGHPRFYEVPQQLGMAERRLTFEDLTADPLPLP